MIDYRVVESYLKSIFYIRLGSKLRTWIGGDVVGFNVYASSQIRKRFTIERLQHEIDDSELPLLIDDSTGDHDTGFRIMIKL